MAGKQADECTVKVVVNCRPLLGFEQERGALDVLRVDSNEITIKDKTFAFDSALPQGATQEAVFERTAEPLLESVFNGFNATVMAYGQTGSGKTYTMGSAFDAGQVSQEQKGIIRRVMDKMFAMIEERSAATEFEVRLSFLEIYHEDICDLLAGGAEGEANKGLQMRECRAKGSTSIEVVGLTEHTVGSPEEMETLLAQGSGKRHTSSTQMNEVSSRSHAICSISLLQSPKVGVNGVTLEEADLHKKFAKFHLVDLAGSERAKSTGAEGDRLKEGISINLSLSVLGNVISALGDEDKQGSHVPYRESTLTRMLQDSLGGNSRTVLVGCVSPADYNLEETKMCLAYVHRARNIKNRPVENRDPTAQKMLAKNQRIKELSAMVRALGGDPGDATEFGGSLDAMPCAGNAAYSFDASRHDEEEIRALNRKLAAAQRQNLELLRATEVAEKSAAAHVARAQKAEASTDRWRAAAEALKRGEQVKLEMVEEGAGAGTVVESQLARIAELEHKLAEATDQGFSCDSSFSAAGDGAEMDTSGDSFEGSGTADEDEDDEKTEQAKEELEEETANFERKKSGMSKELAELEQELQDREDMFKKLADDSAMKEHKQKFDQMRIEHQHREQKMLADLKKVQAELEKLRKSTNNSKSALAHMSEMRKREQALKREQKSIEGEKRRLATMERQQARKDAEMARQQATIDDLKRQKIDVRRRMEKEADEHGKRQKGLKQQMARLQREKERKHAELVKREREHAMKVSAMQQKMDHQKSVMSHARSKEAARRVQRNARQNRGKGLRKCHMRQIDVEIEHEVNQLAKSAELDALNADKSALCDAIAKAKGEHRPEQEVALAQRLKALEATIITESMALQETRGITSGFSIPDKAADAKCIAESLCEQVVKARLRELKNKREVSRSQKEALEVRRQMRLVKRQQMAAEKRYQDAVMEATAEVSPRTSGEAVTTTVSAEPPAPPMLAAAQPVPPMSRRSSFQPPPPPPRAPTPPAAADADEDFGAAGAHAFSDDESEDDQVGGLPANLGQTEEKSRRQSAYLPTEASRRKQVSGIPQRSGLPAMQRKRKGQGVALVQEGENNPLTPNKEKVRADRGKIALKRMRLEKKKKQEELDAAMTNPDGLRAAGGK